MRQAHLITCLSNNHFEQFIQEGFAGLCPKNINKDKVGSNKSKLHYLRTNLDIIADLKRVKKDDYIFIHVIKGKIYGPFIATTSFKESPELPSYLQSVNLTEKYFRQITDFEPHREELPWRIGIRSKPSVTQREGINPLKLFEYKSFYNSIHSIPERFKYHDASKTVKPLLTHETEQILQLIHDNGTEELTVTSQPLTDFQKIELNIETYHNQVYTEKVIEAWLFENIYRDENNETEYQNITETFGETKYYANTVFTYYANFLDILLYNENSNVDTEYCSNCGRFIERPKTDISVIEVKKGNVSSGTLKQVSDYGDWAKQVLANGDEEKVQLYILGADFDDSVIDNDIGIRCIQYNLTENSPYLRLGVIS